MVKNLGSSKSNSSMNPHRKAEKGGMRSKDKIQRLKMYNSGKAIRSKDGKVIGGHLLMNNTAGGAPIGRAARIAPDRRWFGNTRVMSQGELDKFREEMTVKQADPYSVILRRKKIPMAILQESEKAASINVLQVESFNSVFGNKQTRKKPKLSSTITDYETLMLKTSTQAETYEKLKASEPQTEQDDSIDKKKDDIFAKGQSKRIWAELYKVLDCSDVVLQVVDARNVPGTRSEHIEKYIKKHASHKHLVIVINKCDLVPSWVTRKWVKLLSPHFPTLAFHASITNAFGKGALINLLRQFGKLHADKRQISVGVIGYPNTGKSSVINALIGKKSCKAAPVPGETKIWQYISLMRRIFLIDSPGVVYDVGDDEVETVLKGVVRAERLESPEDFVPTILERVRPEHVTKQYSLNSWTDATDFLTQLARNRGKLHKGGEPDLSGVATSVIQDWQRGKLPYYVAPPREATEEDEAVEQPELVDEEVEEMEEGDSEDEAGQEVEEDSDSDDSAPSSAEKNTILGAPSNNEEAVKWDEL